eukprot:259555_1
MVKLGFMFLVTAALIINLQLGVACSGSYKKIVDLQKGDDVTIQSADACGHYVCRRGSDAVLSGTPCVWTVDQKSGEPIQRFQLGAGGQYLKIQGQDVIVASGTANAKFYNIHCEKNGECGFKRSVYDDCIAYGQSGTLDYTNQCGQNDVALFGITTV